MKYAFRRFLAVGIAVTASATPPRVLDAFRYPDERAAAVWRPQNGAPAPRPSRLPGDGLAFLCPFDRAPADRFFWDRETGLDLGDYTSFELDLTCDDPAALRSLAVYFESGDGWYVWNRPLARAGRQPLILRRHEFSTEGRPSGWRDIRRIRLSPWRGSGAAVSLRLHHFRARRDPVLVIAGRESVPAAERPAALRAADRIGRRLAAAGVPYARIEDGDLSPRDLAGVAAALLPYNTQLPDRVLEALRSFVTGGGKLIVFYSADARLAELMGVHVAAWKPAESPLQWTAFRFTDPAALHAPARVYQVSGGLLPIAPAGHGMRAAAIWQDGRGRDTGEIAWLVGERGAWMSHILLPGDTANKQQLLAGLLLRYAPEIGPELADAALRDAGRIDSFATFDEALGALRASAAASPARSRIHALLDEAAGRRARMGRLRAEGRFGEALAESLRLRDALTAAYALAQTPVGDEFRAVWDHTGLGRYPGDWDRTARELRESGINAIFVNALWGGLAHYPSDLVPASTTFRLYGDQLAQCLAAARRHGLRAHLWHIVWNIGNAPPEWRERMAREGRLQRAADGTELPWLNPADERNVELALRAIQEAARRYALDGVHLDYVRWPGADADFGDMSRRAFERKLGRRVARWPADVRPGGPHAEAWREWRAEVISNFVRRARSVLKTARPDAQLSAAVWGNYPECVASIGQDWGLWLRRGWVDFVAPMNYTENLNAFTALTRKQLALPGAAGRLFPGIGVTAGESSLAADNVIEQILAARRLGAQGFALFQLDPELSERVLPYLRLGVTQPDGHPVSGADVRAEALPLLSF